MRKTEKLKIIGPVRLDESVSHGSLRWFFEGPARFDETNPSYRDLYVGVSSIEVEGDDTGKGSAYLVVCFHPDVRTITEIQQALSTVGIETEVQ